MTIITYHYNFLLGTQQTCKINLEKHTDNKIQFIFFSRRSTSGPAQKFLSYKKKTTIITYHYNFLLVTQQTCKINLEMHADNRIQKI